MSSMFAQAVFPGWARQDGVDLFWSPRHHLPLLDKSPKKLLTVHDLVWRRVPQTMVRLGRLTEKLLMPPSLSMADAILVPSKATAADLAEYYPQTTDKIRVTPLASALNVSLESVADLPRTGLNILMVGSLEPRKNIERVVDAFLLLRRQYPEATLTLAGGQGWRSEQLRQRLASLVDQGVEYIGAVDDQRLETLYKQARFVAAPSLYEGWGLSVLEAFSFGKPVLTSNVSSMPEVAGAGGLLVNPESTTEIFRGMLKLVEDEGLYQQMCRAALVRCQQFSWQKTADLTCAVIEQLG